MRFVALVSGGKDSIYSIAKAIENGHQLVACVHLGAPAPAASGDGDGDQEESYMYQTAASEVLKTLVEECIGVPLLLRTRVGKSVNTSMVYDRPQDNDEVEDLYVALKHAAERFPDFTAVSSGAILSNYQRVRIEHVCSRLGLTSLSYLWRLSDQKDLLQRMLSDGIEAVLVRTACPPGLVPHKHLNKSLNVLWASGLLQRMNRQYQFHMCGEGGEYESLVIDAPLYKKRLVLDEVEVVETDDEVGYLRIHKCHAEDKYSGASSAVATASTEASEATALHPSASNDAGRADTQSEAAASSSPQSQLRPQLRIDYLPRCRQVEGGLWHVPEIVAPLAATNTNVNGEPVPEADLAVQEALQVFAILKRVLDEYGCAPRDVMMVHLYLSEMSHFASINEHYRNFFGTLLPPSRSCVAVGRCVLPGGRRVLLDCLVQSGSGLYMRTGANDTAALTDCEYARAAHANTTSRLRQVLHVQSISHWAPVCVGPYSQANTIRSALHFMAGQIGLIPSTMKLRPTWTEQLEQCWTNAAAVLDALNGGELDDIFSGLLYVADKVYLHDDSAVRQIIDISTQGIKENGGIVAGKVESSVPDDLYGGYEDEGTWEEMKGEMDYASSSMKQPPLLLVSIPEMPVGASVEVELIALTKDVGDLAGTVNDATLCRRYHQTSQSLAELSSKVQWDTGHSFSPVATEDNGSSDIALEAAVRSIGHGSAASVYVTASVLSSSLSSDRRTTAVNDIGICTHDLLVGMLRHMAQALAECRSGMLSRNALSIRLYYVASKTARTADGKIVAVPVDDGHGIRRALASAVSSWMGVDNDKLPATTVVPVQGIELLSSNQQRHESFLALHALFLDPVHLETEVWVHKERPRA